MLFTFSIVLESIPWKRRANKKKRKEKGKRRLLLLSTGFLIPLHKFQPTNQVSRKESQLLSLIREKKRDKNESRHRVKPRPIKHIA